MTGVLTTAYLVGKASFTAAEIIRHEESITGTADTRKERFKQRFLAVYPVYIPAAIAGVATIGCIVGASKASASRTTAAVAAYSLTEKAFSEYREKVVEQIGLNKEQKIRDEIAQDRVNANTSSVPVVVGGAGRVVCCELLTGRYFESSMEDLRRAVNDVNAKVVRDLYVTLDEFYDKIGLAYTSNSGKIGWDSAKLMDLQFSTTLAEGGVPCLAFEYNYTKPLV